MTATRYLHVFGHRAIVLQHFVIVCAVLAGLAEVPWQAAALAGAAVFAVQDLGAFEVPPGPRSWRLSIGMGARLLAGS